MGRASPRYIGHVRRASRLLPQYPGAVQGTVGGVPRERASEERHWKGAEAEVERAGAGGGVILAIGYWLLAIGQRRDSRRDGAQLPDAVKRWPKAGALRIRSQ